ncbi:low temperature requirement protein LtrA [Agromyces ramosus]|uniref:Low temperature requirement protein LtrA n=2 Tax=Agromyces ramosus TaxID=33879 RepID=A0A4V2F014_9MICO|nr:low temperature requirement protein LtrA [Agromyces ramosus]
MPRASRDGESARVTTFELFFDLVYVFAFTQVSGLMADTHSALGVLQALVVLGLLWWVWCAYSWLGNQAPADRGVVQAGMSIAMIAVFIVALAIPEAYDDLEGGWYAPLVVALAYLFVRIVHATLYVIVAGEDRALRRQVLGTQVVALVPSGTALIVGAAIGGSAQTWIWLAAFVWDVVFTYVSSRGGGGWRLHSPVHWAERYGLIVILALGESIVAIGVGVAQEPIDGPIVLGVSLSVTLSLLLWRAYFTRIAPAGEHALQRRTGARRVVFARDAYTYLHFAIVGGVILAALGVEEAMAHIADPEAFGWFGASALGAGLALYIAATAAFGRMSGLRWPVVRIGAAIALAAVIPLLAIVAAMSALVIVVALLAVMLVIEDRRPASGLYTPRDAMGRL